MRRGRFYGPCPMRKTDRELCSYQANPFSLMDGILVRRHSFVSLDPDVCTTDARSAFPEVLFSPNHKEKSLSPSSLTKFPSLVSTLIRSVTIPSRCRQRRQASRVSLSRRLKAAQCGEEMSQSSPVQCGDVSKQPQCGDVGHSLSDRVAQ